MVTVNRKVIYHIWSYCVIQTVPRRTW